MTAMIKKFTLYREDNGRIVSSGTASDPESLARPGRLVHLGDRFEGGWLAGGVHYPMPARPSREHSFDWASKTWVDQRTVASQWAAVRLERSRRLTASDWMVVKATETGSPVPQAWQEYRQALRDITGQPDPFNISWPAQP